MFFFQIIVVSLHIEKQSSKLGISVDCSSTKTIPMVSFAFLLYYIQNRGVV